MWNATIPFQRMDLIGRERKQNSKDFGKTEGN